jgi:hypothetical protein
MRGNQRPIWANLNWANLFSAVLDGADFEGSVVGSSVFGGADFSSCKGLESVRHTGPSLLGFDSIINSKGRIPEIFLRGVGLPNEWIKYIASRMTDVIQFFSCFISYSSADKPFADRLYTALQAKGIPCWLDEKQLVAGDDISRELERGIHQWDKFLLCASKNSLTSWWVEGEIRTTLEKERALREERGKPVSKLIPLNLDDYMIKGDWDLGVLSQQIRSRSFWSQFLVLFIGALLGSYRGLFEAIRSFVMAARVRVGGLTRSGLISQPTRRDCVVIEAGTPLCSLSITGTRFATTAKGTNRTALRKGARSMSRRMLPGKGSLSILMIRLYK